MRGGHSHPLGDDYLRPAPLSMANLSAIDFLRDTEPPSAPQKMPAPSSGQKPEATPGGRKVSLTKVKNWFSRGQGLSEEEKTLGLQERSRKGRPLIPDDHGIAEMPLPAETSPQKGTKPKISFPGLKKMSRDPGPLPSSHKASSSFPLQMPSFSSAEESSAAASPITPYSMTKHHVGLLEHLPVVPKEEVAKLPKFLTPNVPEEESHIWHSGRRPSLPLHNTGLVADNGQDTVPTSYHHEPSELKHSRQRKLQQYKGGHTNTGTMQSSPPFEASPVADNAQRRVPFLHYDETSEIKNKREKRKLEKSSHPNTSGGPSLSSSKIIAPAGNPRGYGLPSDYDSSEPTDRTLESSKQSKGENPAVGIKKYRSMSTFNAKPIDENALQSFPPSERAPQGLKYRQPDRFENYQDIDPLFSTSGYPSQFSPSTRLAAGNAGIAQSKPSTGGFAQPLAKHDRYGRVRKYKENGPMISEMELNAIESARREEAARERYAPLLGNPTAASRTTQQQQLAMRSSKDSTGYDNTASHTYVESPRSYEAVRDGYQSPATMTRSATPTARQQLTTLPIRERTPISQFYNGLQQNSSRMPAAPVSARFGNAGARVAGEAGGDGSPTPSDIIDEYGHHRRSSSSRDSNRGSATRRLFR